MATVLDTILAYKRREVEAAKAACPASALRARAEVASPVRPFAGAMLAATAREPETADAATLLKLYETQHAAFAKDRAAALKLHRRCGPSPAPSPPGSPPLNSR